MNAFFCPLNGGFYFAKIRGFKVTDYNILVRMKKGKDGKVSKTPEELKVPLPSNWQPLAVNSK